MFYILILEIKSHFVNYKETPTKKARICLIQWDVNNFQLNLNVRNDSICVGQSRLFNAFPCMSKGQKILSGKSLHEILLLEFKFLFLFIELAFLNIEKFY